MTSESFEAVHSHLRASKNLLFKVRVLRALVELRLKIQFPSKYEELQGEVDAMIEKTFEKMSHAPKLAVLQAYSHLTRSNNTLFKFYTEQIFLKQDATLKDQAMEQANFWAVSMFSDAH